jgi:hypothetical protein
MDEYENYKHKLSREDFEKVQRRAEALGMTVEDYVVAVLKQYLPPGQKYP